CQPGDL
ncbi:hypothetical protein CP01DC11_1317B, partial [Chlamydia psittaci 01DC11]